MDPSAAIPPTATEAELSQLAQQQPALHTQIVNHPQVSAPLLEWIAQQSPDPQARQLAAQRLQAPQGGQPMAQPGAGAKPGSSRRTLIVTMLATLVVAAIVLTVTELTGLTHLVRKPVGEPTSDAASSSATSTPSKTASGTPSEEPQEPRGAGDLLTVTDPADTQGSFSLLTYQQAEPLESELPANALLDANSNAFADGAELFVLTDEGPQPVPLDDDIADILALHSAVAAVVNKDGDELRLIDVENGAELGVYSVEDDEKITDVVISSTDHIVLEVANGGDHALVGIDGNGEEQWRSENLDFTLGCPAGSEVNIENGVRYLHGERECTIMVDSQTGELTDRGDGVVTGQYDGAVVVYEEDRVVIYDGEMEKETASYAVPRSRFLSPAGWKDYAGRSPHLSDTATLADLKAGLAKLDQEPPAAAFYGVTSDGLVISIDTITGGTVIWRGENYQCDEGIDVIDAGQQLVCYNANGNMEIYDAGLTTPAASYSGVRAGTAFQRFNGTNWVVRSDDGDFLFTEP